MVVRNSLFEERHHLISFAQPQIGEKSGKAAGMKYQLVARVAIVKEEKRNNRRNLLSK